MAETITTNATLRGLLRIARRHANLSQKEAAGLAGCSAAWWKKVESAYEVVVRLDTMTAMLDAVQVLPEHLDDIGQPQLAELLMARRQFRRITDSRGGVAELEEYLSRAPASQELRDELITYVQARTVRRIGKTEPFGDQFTGKASQDGKASK